MTFLLDTNVVSEWVKPRPEPRVAAWLAAVDEDRVFLSVVTLAELRHGVERLPSGSRRSPLDEWLRHDLPLRFEGRVLPIDATVAEVWGAIVARRERAGRPMSAMDAFGRDGGGAQPDALDSQRPRLCVFGDSGLRSLAGDDASQAE